MSHVTIAPLNSISPPVIARTFLQSGGLMLLLDAYTAQDFTGPKLRGNDQVMYRPYSLDTCSRTLRLDDGDRLDTIDISRLDVTTCQF